MLWLAGAAANTISNTSSLVAHVEKAVRKRFHIYNSHRMPLTKHEHLIWLGWFLSFRFAGFPKRIHSLWQIDLLHISCTKDRTRKTPALQRGRWDTELWDVVGCCGRRSRRDPVMTTDNNGNENINNINNIIINNNNSNNNVYEFSPFVFGASYHGVALVSLACKNLRSLSIWAMPHELYEVSQP